MIITNYYFNGMKLLDLDMSVLEFDLTEEVNELLLVCLKEQQECSTPKIYMHTGTVPTWV